MAREKENPQSPGLANMPPAKLRGGSAPSNEWTKNGDVVPEEMLGQRTYTHSPGEADGPGHVGWKVKAKQTGSWDGNKPQGF